MKDRHKTGAFDVLRDRDFLLLALPNFIRGIGSAVIGMLAVFAVADHVIADTDGQMLTTYTQIATLMSCTLYAALTPRIKSPRLCLVGAVLVFALIPAFFTVRIGFFVLFTVAYIGYVFINYAVPDMVYQAVDSEIMVTFHTWRLAFMTAGSTVETALIGVLIGNVPNILLVSVDVGACAVCSLAYFMVFKERIIQAQC